MSVVLSSESQRFLNVSLEFMNIPNGRSTLLLSLQRALLGEVRPGLRQASIEADQALQIVRLRFEYDGPPSTMDWDSASRVAAEVIADFPAGWQLDEQYLDTPVPDPLQALALVAYRRAEPPPLT